LRFIPISTLIILSINSKETATNRPQLVVIDGGSGFTRSIKSSEINKEQAGILIYPNPVKENLVIQNYSGAATARFYDAAGMMVKQLSIGANSINQIPVGRLKNGLYLIKIENEQGVMTKKIVINN
jgi:hypothetical protein